MQYEKMQVYSLSFNQLDNIKPPLIITNKRWVLLHHFVRSKRLLSFMRFLFLAHLRLAWCEDDSEVINLSNISFLAHAHAFMPSYILHILHKVNTVKFSLKNDGQSNTQGFFLLAFTHLQLATARKSLFIFVALHIYIIEHMTRILFCTNFFSWILCAHAAIVWRYFDHHITL